MWFQEAASPHTNGDHATLSNSSEIRENGNSNNGDKIKVERPPSRSGSSSSRSTPSLKSKDVRLSSGTQKAKKNILNKKYIICH